MKFKTTNKEIKHGFSVVVAVGYCDAQNLFNGREPVAYTAGVYGWNADVYTDLKYRNIAVVTGYRPTGSSAFYDIVKEYDIKALLISTAERPDDMPEPEFYWVTSEKLAHNRAEFFKAVHEMANNKEWRGARK